MIQLQEDDILWKGYLKCHYYLEERVEPPTNLCGYFWKSLFGYFLIFACEASIPVHALLFTTLLLSVILTHSFILVILTLYSGMNLLFRVGVLIPDKYLEMFGKYVFLPVGGMVAICLFSFFGWEIYKYISASTGEQIYSGVRRGVEGFGWLMLTGVALVISVWAIINIFKLNSVKRLLSQLWSLICAIKTRACPLVTPPETWEPEADEGEPEADEGEPNENKQG